MRSQMPRDESDKSLLRQRALEYAGLHHEAHTVAGLDVLTFRVGQERYAVELQVLRSVQHARGLAKVPCTPRFVAGILNLRGEVITVLRVGELLELPAAPTPLEDAHVLLVEVRGHRFGVLVDAVLGVQSIDAAELARSLSGRDFSRGLADGVTVLLNLEHLFAERRFEVFEEVT